MKAMYSLSNKTFDRISQFVAGELGIKMPPVKKVMLQGRLMKRLRHLEMDSFEAYCDYLFSKAGRQNEMVHMLDAVTTNKTDFFREPRHFSILERQVLPELVRPRSSWGCNHLVVWSAGCSTGAEPYTLAMVLSEYARKNDGVDFTILATDISSRVLAHAEKAIYSEKEAAPISPALKNKYLLRSKDPCWGLVRIVPELRGKVKFGRLNLMDGEYGIPDDVDVIFFRNVLIYFDRLTQQRVLSHMCRHLRNGGYLFSGHSETLNGFELPLTQVATTVYKRN